MSQKQSKRRRREQRERAQQEGPEQISRAEVEVRDLEELLKSGDIDRYAQACWSLANSFNHSHKLDFTHFKRHKRGNLQYDGTEWRGVSVHRSWRSIVKNPPTPTTSGYAQR